MTFGRHALLTSALAAVPLAAVQAQAQATTGTVVGRVVHATTQEPIVGARVVIVGDSTHSVLTRADGRFTMPGIATGARRVRVTRLGFAPQIIPVTVVSGQQVVANAQLQVAAVALSEVVTVGYGTQRRSDLTGSVASVSTQQVQQTSINSVEQGLQGRLPGVQVTQNDAAPGGALSVQVRGVTSPNGSNQPLYVVDGVPVQFGSTSKNTLGASEPSFVTMTTTNPLTTIAPSDIESIEVLKDASATAIYGSRAANGVVIITTKRGRRGDPGQLTLNYSEGRSAIVREVDVLNIRDYTNYANRAVLNAGRPAAEQPYGGDPLRSVGPDSLVKLYGAGINWQDRIFQSAATRDLQVGFLGSDAAGTGGFGISANYLDQGGIVIGSGFQRGGLRMNLDREVNRIFRVSGNLSGTRSKSSLVRTSGTEGTTAQGIIRSAIRYSPLPSEAFDTSKTAGDPRAENGDFFRRFGANPVRYTDEVNESETVSQGFGNVRAVARVYDGLTFEQSVGGNYYRKQVDSYFPRTVYEGFNAKGLAVLASSDYGQLLSESLVRYSKEFNPSNRVEAVGGFTFEYNSSNYLNNQVSNFDNDRLGSAVLQNALVWQTPRTGPENSRLASWLGRLNYTFRDRYMFTGTVRTDGASRFAQNNKWATFSSVGLAWRAKEESFFRHIDDLSELKVRASYGQSGNQGIGSYQSLATIQGATTVIGEQLVSAAFFGRLANPNLKWETTTQGNLGVDLGFWQNRLTVTGDVYDKRTDDLLQSVLLATSTGYDRATFNSGAVRNRGVELQADVRILDGSSTRPSWNLSGNFSRNRNRILNLGATQQQFSDRLGAGGGLEVNPFIQKPGLPIGAVWGYRTNGIYRTAAEVNTNFQADARVGDWRYVDVDGDGKLTEKDQTQIGDINPAYTFGLTNTIRFRRFDFSALVSASQGNDIINAQRLNFLTLNGTNGNIPQEFYDNAFDPQTNPNGKYPMIRSDRQGAGRFSDAFVEDGSFVRLKNVQLGYTMPTKFLRGVSSARLYVNGINLLTSTKYTGFDPEVSAFSEASMRGVDLGSYPQSRLITVGANLVF